MIRKFNSLNNFECAAIMSSTFQLCRALALAFYSPILFVFPSHVGQMERIRGRAFKSVPTSDTVT